MNPHPRRKAELCPTTMRLAADLAEDFGVNNAPSSRLINYWMRALARSLRTRATRAERKRTK